MTFITPLTLKLVVLAVVTVLAGTLVTAAPAGAIVNPTQCGIIKVKGKRWQITAKYVRCSKAKKWAATYIRSFKSPRYYKCVRGTAFYRVCEAKRYDPVRTFFIKQR